MLRGATVAAQRWPCELLVGGEALDVCQAKECALGVRHLATSILVGVWHCPALPLPSHSRGGSTKEL